MFCGAIFHDMHLANFAALVKSSTTTLEQFLAYFSHGGPMSSFRNFKVSLIAVAVSHSIAVNTTNAQTTSIVITDGQFVNETTASDGSNGGNCVFCFGSADSGEDGNGGIQTFVVSGDISTTADIGSELLPAIGLFGSGGAGGSTLQQFNTAGFGLDITIGDTTANAGVYLFNQGGDGGNGGDSGDASAGNGGDGGSGREISIIIDDGNITTENNSIHGIYAQSAGGSGGDGGDGEVFGSGGDVDDSNDITIDTGGNIQTFGAGSNGIIAQNIADYADDAGDEAGFVSFSSDGGSGADAGGLSIDNTADITTVSDEARI